MHGKLIFTCPACGQRITWVKITWHRPEDGAFDWDLDVRCGCGEVVDPLIRRTAFADYHVQLRELVRDGQNGLIDRAMGPRANAAVEQEIRRRSNMDAD